MNAKGLATLITFITACGGTAPAGPSPSDAPRGEVEAHEGEIGLVLDARDIVRKGYLAATAELKFPEHSDLDATLPVDPITHFALLRIENASLSEAVRAELAGGVALEVTVRSADASILAQHEADSVILDDSNVPLILQSDLPAIELPLSLDPETPYLLQPDGKEGVLSSWCSDCYRFEDYVPDSPTQQIYFKPVESSTVPNTVTVEHYGYGEGELWYVSESGWIALGGDSVTIPADAPREFVLEQAGEGWVRIRVAGTDRYLVQQVNELRTSASESDRFRLISDAIQWEVVDRGTVYHEPITPPARVDFAYEADIRNCSPGTLTETVGKAQSRTRSTTTETSESLQLFSSEELSIAVKVGVEIGANVGVGQVKGSVEATESLTFTTSQTRTTENTFSATIEETSDVSRVRELEVPPFTGIQIHDVVRTIDDVRVPFTQILRVTGRYRRDGTPVSGSEILTQMQFNFVSGLPAEVGASHVDMTLRGQVHIDQLFEATTEANEIMGACD
jgi:hypothetical protein